MPNLLTWPRYIQIQKWYMKALLVENCKRVTWHNGQIFLWMARKKIVGIGEGSSGLKFNVIDEKNDIIFIHPQQKKEIFCCTSYLLFMLLSVFKININRFSL